MSRRQQHEQESSSSPSRERRTLGGNGARTPFKYQARTAEHVKVRAEQQGGMYDNIFKQFPTYKAKVGNNLLRILPPTWQNADHYGYDIYRHEQIGPDNSMYLCLKEMKGEPCPICEERAELDRLKEDKDAAELRPRHRVVVWVIDRDKENEGPMVWDMSWTMDKDIAALSTNSRSGEILLIDHPTEGYDFEFSREGTTMTNTKYMGKAIARRSSPINDDPDMQDEWLNFIMINPIPTVLNFYSYEHISQVFTGQVKEQDDEPQRISRNTVSTKSLREELDDEIPEKEVAKPVTRRRIVRDEEEPPFEEPSKPKVARGRKRIVDDDEEAEEGEVEAEEEEQTTTSIAERTRTRLEERRTGRR